MSRYIPLQRSIHGNAGFTPSTDMSYASKMTTVPLVREELSQVIQHMGIVFQKRPNGENAQESFELVALQSLKPSENLFILPNNQWLGGYKPAFYRAHPFSLEVDQEKKSLQMCILEEAVKHDITPNDIPFFKNETDLSDQMMQRVDFLQQTLNGRKNTLRLILQLHEADLIVPWPITYQEKDENDEVQSKVLDGLYHIDRKALMTLPAETVARLNASGALEVAYVQLLSESRVAELSTLQNVHKDLKKQLNQSKEEPDLDELFGEKGDLFSF